MQSSEENAFFYAAVILIIVFSLLLIVSFALSRPSSYYTAVFFDESTIFNNAGVGETKEIRFFVENQEGEEKNYFYNIFIGNQIVESNNIVIASNEKKEINASITFEEANESEKILVNVTKPPVILDYNIYFFAKIS